MRSVVRRKSPRGSNRTRAPAPSGAAASAARKRRWSSSTRAGAERQRALGGAPVGVGKERVVAHVRRKGAFDEPTHEHAVEVEAETESDMPHEDSVAETADATQIGVELELERAAEDVEAGRRLDRVEPGEAFERGLHLVGRALLRLGPLRTPRVVGEEVVHDPPCPGGQIVPGHPFARALAQRVAELGNERVELAGGLELVLVPIGARFAVGYRELLRQLGFQHARMTVEPLVPLRGASYHAGAPADALPPC